MAVPPVLSDFLDTPNAPNRSGWDGRLKVLRDLGQPRRRSPYHCPRGLELRSARRGEDPARDRAVSPTPDRRAPGRRPHRLEHRSRRARIPDRRRRLSAAWRPGRPRRTGRPDDRKPGPQVAWEILRTGRPAARRGVAGRAMATSSVRPPTRYGGEYLAAASAPVRTGRPSPSTAAPASRCSSAATHLRSTTSKTRVRSRQKRKGCVRGRSRSPPITVVDSQLPDRC